MTATATAAAKITYRKTKTGTWVAYGPASEIKAGATVTVTRKSGEAKTEHIESVGKTFRVEGRDMCYGYIAKSTPRASSYGSPRYARYEQRTCEACEWNQDAGDMNGCPRHRGNPHC